MSEPRPPKPARPFANFFYTDEAALAKAIDLLDGRLGPRCFTSEPEPFEISRYYEPEMGPGIMRRFAAWELMVDPAELVDIKLATWDMEQKLSADKPGRKVNIDPGLISEGHVLLATGKPVPHRPYMGRGVYVDLTLIYFKGSYKPLEWTYPDYAGDDIIEMMNSLRKKYMADLKKIHNDDGSGI